MPVITTARAAGVVAACNIGVAVTDTHVAAGRGHELAVRFLSKTDPPDADGTPYTYQHLADESTRFASALAGLGVPAGSSVFVLAGRIPGLYVSILGALKGGYLVCPLFSAFGPEPIRQRLTLGDAEVLVTTGALYERKIAPMRGELKLAHVILLDVDAASAPDGTISFGALLETADTTPLPVVTSTETPALLHFTSGTTGTPKGAVLVHGALDMQRRTTRDVLGVQPSDVYWCTADPGWVTGTSYGIIGPLSIGASMLVDEAEFDAERWYTMLASQHVSVWYTAPTAIRMLMRAGGELVDAHDLTGVREAFSVGEPLDADAVEWGIQGLGITFRDTWWQTETGAIMIANATGAPVRPGSMGRTVEGIEATLLATDDDGELVRDPDGHVRELSDPDAIGMIALRPGWSSMFRTYLNADERYRKAFADGWYLAGDLARRDRDGYFWFVGRADDVIKTAGHLIGPFEVESVLNEHRDVVSSGVYGVPDPVAGNVIHARVVLREGVAPTADTMSSVMAHARRRLGGAVAPREIVAVDELPLTRSGKVMRRLLRARELGLPEGDLSTLEGSGDR